MTMGPPMVITSGSDDGILKESRELLKFYRHTHIDFCIFINMTSICIQKVSFGEVELMKKTTDGLWKFSMISVFWMSDLDDENLNK